MILGDPKSIKDAKFIENADFKFLIHGYTQWKNSPDWLSVREGKFLHYFECVTSSFHQYHCINFFAEYFKQKPWNILIIDYNPVARWGCYFDTLKPSIIKIGECIADFFNQLFKTHPKITINRFHFVGFSMGSQICAQVSNCLKSGQIIIPRITGIKLHVCIIQRRINIRINCYDTNVLV